MGVCKKCKKIIKGDFDYCYGCINEKREKDFQSYGSHRCKKCLNTVIPKNRSYCTDCAKKIFK